MTLARLILVGGDGLEVWLGKIALRPGRGDVEIMTKDNQEVFKKCNPHSQVVELIKDGSIFQVASVAFEFISANTKGRPKKKKFKKCLSGVLGRKSLKNFKETYFCI